MNLTETQTTSETTPSVASSTSIAGSQEASRYRLHRRFDRMGRLVGDQAMEKLFNSHIAIIGLGGVGSWAAESLIRSGVGEITIVDFDEVCITNFNRQLHALQGVVGEKKAKVLGERLQKINPGAKINIQSTYYAPSNHEAIFQTNPNRPFDWVLDAIDQITSKCHLLAECKKRNIKVITSTGSGGRLDPSHVKVTDLSKTELDPLARQVRRILREQYGFPQKGSFEIPAIYSSEPVKMPVELNYDNGKGFKCVCPQGQNGFFECDNRNVIMGNSSFVTGSFGLMAASVIVRDLTA